MNRRIRVDVITQKKGLFGMRNVVKYRTITVSGREYRQMQRDRKNTAARNEAEHLAGLVPALGRGTGGRLTLYMRNAYTRI